MGLFGNDEIKTMMAKAEAMMTIDNRPLFKKHFLEGYAVGGNRVPRDNLISDAALRRSSLTSMDEWSWNAGFLAGLMKSAPVQFLLERNSVPFIINLYSSCDAVGAEKAKKIIRGLISAWQKRLQPIIAMDVQLNAFYRKFLYELEKA